MARRAQRPTLTTDRVLDAALALVDRDGVDALSMRRLATELGFEVMSLYNHVASKEAVLAGIAERVASEIEAPEDAPPRRGRAAWKAGIRHTVLSARDAFRRHPWAAPLWAAVTPGPNRLRFQEGLLRSLRSAGFSPSLAYHGYHALMIHGLGSALLEQQAGLDAESVVEGAGRFLAQFEGETFPYLIEHMHQHVDAPPGEDDFELVLDLILDGLDRLRR